jgi:uncharacterized membrane protein (UPF0127 family)
MMTSEQRFIARDLDTGLIVAARVAVATTRAQRRIGLLKHDHLDPGEGLWIAPCNGVHTCFMKFSIDILAMDRDGVVVDAVSTLKPWRMRLPRAGSWSVLELRAGTLMRAAPALGHRIAIEGFDQTSIQPGG